MKKLWNAVSKPLKNTGYQWRAIKRVEKIAAGEVTEAAPKHKGEKKYFEEIQKDKNIRKDLETKHEQLVDNMYKIKITSTDVKEEYPTKRELPTKESEMLHRNDPVWEYGFYEPPVEKIPKGKLMFREALEILHARQELFGDQDIPRTKIPESKEVLQKHPAIERIGEERFDKIWQYFRPFERHDTQNVVRISELEELKRYLDGYSQEGSLIEDFRMGFAKLLSDSPEEKRAFDKLDETEQRKFMMEVMRHRLVEHKRLATRLAELESGDASQKEKEKIEQIEGATVRKPGEKDEKHA